MHYECTILGDIMKFSESFNQGPYLRQDHVIIFNFTLAIPLQVYHFRSALQQHS